MRISVDGEHPFRLSVNTHCSHNPRRGEKIELTPAEAVRYNERTAAGRSNGLLNDESGGNTIIVKGDAKVMGHLMFGVLALTADQLMRWRQ